MRKKTHDILNMTRFKVTCISICAAAYILLILHDSPLMSRHKNNEHKQYIIAVNAINNINFDGLKHDELILSNGTHMKIETPTKYPDDRIVYYQDIVLSVENDNGLAKVVTAFDKHGEEISMPF